MNKRHCKAVVDYLMATRNEIAVDRSLYILLGVRPEELGFAPRPSRIVSLCKNQRLLRIVVGVLKVLWRNGGAPLYYLIDWWRVTRGVNKGAAAIPPPAEVYGLALSSRTVDLATSSMKGESFIWAKVPWVDAQFNDEKVVDLLAILGFKDFMRAFFLSCVASRKLNSSMRTRAWGLQSYTAFRWFCVRLALERLPARRLLTSEHFDRWAVLVDTVIKARRPGDASWAPTGLILLQHGVLTSLGAKDDHETHLSVRLAARLRNVIELYVFDHFSSDIFQKEVFSRLCRLDSQNVHIYAPSLHLAKMPDAKGVNVLFVGHPVCEELHLQIASVIGSTFEVGCFYKPHPANPCTERVSQGAWSVIADRKVFPVVDVLISYPSTLVQEYEGAGIPAITHPLNMSASGADELVNLVVAKLESLGCEKRLTGCNVQNF